MSYRLVMVDFVGVLVVVPVPGPADFSKASSVFCGFYKDLAMAGGAENYDWCLAIQNWKKRSASEEVC